jgi:hypothetical protein
MKRKRGTELLKMTELELQEYFENSFEAKISLDSRSGKIIGTLTEISCPDQFIWLGFKDNLSPALPLYTFEEYEESHRIIKKSGVIYSGIILSKPKFDITTEPLEIKILGPKKTVRVIFDREKKVREIIITHK